MVEVLQALLLHHIPSVEFKCHVAKACHHGSEDISTTFLRAMAPMATLFSSGDNETHAHPRAKVLGMSGAFTNPIASGTSKFLDLEERKHVAPLIYSTELSRSVALYEPGELEKGGRRVTGATLKSRGAGGRNGPTKKLSDWLLADSMIYATAKARDATVWTQDDDFRNLPGVNFKTARRGSGGRGKTLR